MAHGSWPATPKYLDQLMKSANYRWYISSKLSNTWESELVPTILFAKIAKKNLRLAFYELIRWEMEKSCMNFHIFTSKRKFPYNFNAWYFAILHWKISKIILKIRQSDKNDVIFKGRYAKNVWICVIADMYIEKNAKHVYYKKFFHVLIESLLWPCLDFKA